MQFVHHTRELCLTILAVVLVSFPASAQRWHRVGGDYAGVHRDDDVIIAVGSSGSILRSIDDGATWSTSNSGTWESLDFVGIARNGRGWTMGDNGTVLATTDRGLTWAQVNAPSYITVNAFSMAQVGAGMAIVDSSRILRATDDGGWSEIGRFPETEVLSISMIDADHGVAVAPDGKIYTTSDGGVSWSKTFDDATQTLTSVAMNTDGRGLACGYGGSVLETVDSGSTWVTRPGPGTGIDGLACAIRNDRAIIVGALGTGSPQGVIAGSTDGGETWSIETPDLRLQGPQALTSVSIGTDGHAVAAGNLGTILLHAPGEQYWKPAANSIASDQVGVLPTLKYGSFASADTAIISHGLLTTSWLRTTDAGITWRTHWGSNASVQFAEVTFFNSTDGVAIVDGFRRRTTNAGLTWQQTGFAVDGTPRSVDFLTRTHWLMASDGGVRRSLDSGDTWSLAPVVATPYMMFVRKTAAGFAVAAGRTNPGASERPLYRALYRSDDGGATWRPILQRETGRNIVAADFTDSLTGVAISDSILRTTDGGASWSSTAAPDVMTSVRFFNSRDGIIVGFNNLILRTSDAGASWSRDSIFAPDPGVPYPAFEDVILSRDRTTMLALGRGVIARLTLDEPLMPASVDGSVAPTKAVPAVLGVRPVPTRDGFVELDASEFMSGRAGVRIYDLLGRLALEFPVDVANRISIDLSSLPDGSYRVVLASEDELRSNWIIIARR